ncbi:hypothetical protein ACMHYC_10955 [Acinetobacter courvalinii]|uniref:hypothetical protein n=1 Tax=Acinetobacter courvalinii TaxID=280147 RepID=UPI0039C8DE08
MNAQTKPMITDNDNMDLWNQVFITDPLAVTPITGKTYKGSSPKPYWLIKQATKIFGPAGLGWGHNIIDQGFQPCGQDDMLHWAIVEFWYIKDEQRCAVQHMGGTKAMYRTSTNKLVVDDDAPKKSVTDALVKAMSSIGFAGDIFSGRWDDSKYQQDAYEHHHPQQPTQPNESDYQKALQDINNAENLSALVAIWNQFKSTQYAELIKKSTAAKRDKEGWAA